MFEEDGLEDQPRRRPRPVRRTWDRNPPDLPHVAKKGKKGYERHREKEDLRRYLEEMDENEEE
jgi:hypothetical protein